MSKVRAYTRSDGTKVKEHSRAGNPSGGGATAPALSQRTPTRPQGDNTLYQVPSSEPTSVDDAMERFRAKREEGITTQQAEPKGTGSPSEADKRFEEGLPAYSDKQVEEWLADYRKGYIRRATEIQARMAEKQLEARNAMSQSRKPLYDFPPAVQNVLQGRIRVPSLGGDVMTVRELFIHRALQGQRPQPYKRTQYELTGPGGREWQKVPKFVYDNWDDIVGKATID